MNMVRLDKYVSHSTGLSRSEVKKLLLCGQITVNGSVIKSGDMKISDLDSVLCRGKLCIYKKNVYYMLNKPQGYISATEDGLHKTVNELFPEEISKRVFPSGRLDIDTEGLLIMTDDGELVHRLTSPSHGVKKVYYAKLEGIVRAEHADIFSAGIPLGDFTAKPALLDILSIDDKAGTSEVRITVTEGKFHQVKRMAEYIGCKVTYLKREKIGSLCLDEALEPGEYRELTEQETDILKKE